jgi:tetratricopeptide (TPR) repeat protein
MDLQGRTGSYYDEYRKATVPYVEAAEFALGQTASQGRKPDPGPLREFITKRPTSVLVKDAYRSLSYYYGYQAPKEEAGAFFDEAVAKFPDEKGLVTSYLARIVRDRGPVDRGLRLAEKLKEKISYPRDPEVQEYLAQLYALKEEPAKAEEEYGKDFADDYVSNAIFALTGYGNFWLEQGKNLESVEEMADIAAAISGAKREAPTYFLSQIAMLYARLEKLDKALALYGPAFAQKNWDDQMALYSYASFWNRQGKNLESAVAAAKRSVELKPDYFNTFVLGQVLFKAKDYPAALQAAEKALELAKPMAAKYDTFTTTQYENLIKQIKEAMAKGPGGETPR